MTQMTIESVGSSVLEILETATSGFSHEEVLQQLEGTGVDWHISESGDLFIRCWQLAATSFTTAAQAADLRRRVPVDPHRAQLDWVAAQLPTLRRSYGGCWIAVVDEHVVASAQALPELLEAIQASGYEEPFITQIPDDEVIWKTAFAR